MPFQKLDIKLVMLGHAKRLVDIQKLQRYKSNFFQIKDVVEIEALPEKDIVDGYLNIRYSPQRVTKILENESGSLVVGIMLYPYNDNFYMHRAGENKLCISLAEISHILRSEKISIENFIIKNVLEAVLLHKLFNGCNSDRLYEFPHSDTRGCIFDMNGDIRDIIYNTEKPILCNECKGKINGKSLPKGYLSAFEKELAKIDKTPSQKFESWVGKHPFQYAFLTLIVTAILTIGINILTNHLCK